MHTGGLRMDKKKVCFNADPKVIKQIKHLAVELDKPLTNLYMEALQDLLKKYEKKKSKK